MAVAGAATPAYTPIAGVASDNNFDPTNANSFFQNFNDASVNYSANLTLDQQRYNDLVSAYKYLQDPANQATLDSANGQGYSQYLIGEMTKDIGEQQNLITQANDQTGATTAATAQTEIGGLLSQMSSGNFNINAGQWGDLVSYMQQAGINPTVSPEYVSNLSLASHLALPQNTPPNLVSLIQAAIKAGNPNQILAQIGQQLVSSAGSQLNTALQKGFTNANSSLATAQNTATQGFTLNQPYYQGAENQLANYYYGSGGAANPLADPNSQIYQATNAADQNIYDQVYNIKNDINNKASQLGVSNSGERQQAIGSANSQAIQAATGLQQNAMNAAQTQIDQYQKQVQQMQNQQQTLTNQVQGGTYADMMNASTGNEVAAYDAQTGAQNSANLANSEQQLAQQQANNGMWNNIFGTAGSALGTLGGTALTGGVI